LKDLILQSLYGIIQEAPQEFWWTLWVGTVVLLTLAVALIAIIVSNQRRFITAQRNQLEQLSRSEQKYRNLFENSLAGVVRILLQDRTAVDLNRALLKMIGDQSVEEARRFLFRIPLPDQDRLMAALQNKGTVENFETHLKRPDGSTLWISFSGRSFPNDGYIEAVIIDITERMRAEERIREQAALLDKAQDAIIVLSLNGGIFYWNKSAERLYGWTNDEILGKSVAEFLYPGDYEAAYQRSQKFTVMNGEWDGELRQVNKAGAELITDCRWTLVRTPEGEPDSILMVNTDVSEKKKLEAQFLRAQRMESIGVLAGGIAHDLNNILAPITIALDLVKRKSNDELMQKVISGAEYSAKRGAEMIKQVLTFARGIGGQRITIEPRHLINEVFKISKETFPKTIQLHSDLPVNLWKVMGDATQLHQVFMNLFVNARDAMPQGGMLDIKGENINLDESFSRTNPEAKVGPYVVFTVSDTGAGIPSANKDKIFEPFFTTKEIGKGTGLGLSTALGIVKSHGGFLTVESAEQRGATFRVYLPAVLGEDIRSRMDEDEDLPRGHGEVVLVIDDEQGLREIAKATLETHGYGVLTANDGSEAVGLYSRNSSKVKAVITDMMMPHMGGTETIHALHRLDPAVRIVATTGLTMPEDLKVGENELVRAVLLKPYTASKLLKTLREVLLAKPDRHASAP